MSCSPFTCRLRLRVNSSATARVSRRHRVVLVSRVHVVTTMKGPAMMDPAGTERFKEDDVEQVSNCQPGTPAVGEASPMPSTPISSLLLFLQRQWGVSSHVGNGGVDLTIPFFWRQWFGVMQELVLWTMSQQRHQSCNRGREESRSASPMCMKSHPSSCGAGFLEYDQQLSRQLQEPRPL